MQVRTLLLKSVITVIAVMLSHVLFAQSSVLLEAEGFADPGGWMNDNQSMMQMGSPYLIAHGIGCPVEDAVTTFNLAK